jgi:pectinesterase
MFRLLTLLISSAGLALAINSPPSGAITIGKGGKYSTFKAALADTSASTYFVYAGTYTEQVYITRSNIKIYGQTPHTDTYASNEVTITGKLSATEAGNDDLSGTVRVHADGVALYNLNIENTYGHPVTQSQAIALSVYGTKFGGYGLKASISLVPLPAASDVVPDQCDHSFRATKTHFSRSPASTFLFPLSLPQ